MKLLNHLSYRRLTFPTPHIAKLFHITTSKITPLHRDNRLVVTNSSLDSAFTSAKGHIYISKKLLDLATPLELNCFILTLQFIHLQFNRPWLIHALNSQLETFLVTLCNHHPKEFPCAISETYASQGAAGTLLHYFNQNHYSENPTNSYRPKAEEMFDTIQATLCTSHPLKGSSPFLYTAIKKSISLNSSYHRPRSAISTIPSHAISILTYRSLISIPY
ncbi:hypothetical protein DSO57_1018905 [Entomophthora muscae]|uniref:Uncharacterized protein n=1 Tax=Entomophthora muscae TaxID=34485 RepID=A0ACC2TR95_9FUNG|nr:hypothetical protein DSO57_1018905 [Entomophthora muscae]